MATVILDNIGSGNGLLPDGTKPLPEPMLTYHQRGSVAYFWEQFRRNCSRYRFRIWVWKRHFEKYFKSPRGQWVNSFMSHVAIYTSNVLRKKKQYHKLSKEFIHNSIMYYTCELFLWYFCNLVCPIIGYCIIGCCLIVYPIHHLFVSSLPVSHYNDVIITTMSSQITSLAIVTQPFIQTQIKENIKAPGHWPVMRKMFPFDDVIMRMTTSAWQGCWRWYSWVSIMS